MSENVIYVSPIVDSKWQVVGGEHDARLFGFREHALAFARALAYSTRSVLIVLEEDGSEVLQSRASMTYPLDLH
jgi:hypothetical protein